MFGELSDNYRRIIGELAENLIIKNNTKIAAAKLSDTFKYNRTNYAHK